MPSMKTATIRGTGWLRDLSSEVSKMRSFRSTRLPLEPFRAPSVSLSLLDAAPAVQDQGQTSSCTAFAWKGALDTAAVTHGHESPDVSVRFLYANARLKVSANEAFLTALGQVSPLLVLSDEGTSLYWMAEMASATGLLSEREMPFDASVINDVPAFDDYVAARAKRLSPTGHFRIFDTGSARLDQIDRALAARTPVVFGTPVSSAFMQVSPGDGSFPLAAPKDEEVVGQHAMVIFGRRLWGTERYYLLRNSWSEGWGGNMMPDGVRAPPGYAWVEGAWMADDRCSDFTVVAFDLAADQAA